VTGRGPPAVAAHPCWPSSLSAVSHPAGAARWSDPPARRSAARRTRIGQRRVLGARDRHLAQRPLAAAISSLSREAVPSNPHGVSAAALQWQPSAAHSAGVRVFIDSAWISSRIGRPAPVHQLMALTGLSLRRPPRRWSRRSADHRHRLQRCSHCRPCGDVAAAVVGRGVRHRR
jgi:hypothetical protein